MKKLVPVLAIFSLAFTLAGCGTNPSESTAVEGESSRFVTVEESSVWDVVYDKETLVMYAVSDGYNNYGTFTMLVNADGTPLLYEE